MSKASLRFVIQLKRAYEAASADDGQRILVDRLWPRGVSKAKARIDRWAKDLAPSTELRRWFGHDPEKWPGFQMRYRQELADREGSLREIAEASRGETVTLIYAARDSVHNDAAVLKEVLSRMVSTRSEV